MADENDEKPGIVKKLGAVVGLLASTLFLANLKVFPPEIPDLMPLVGNLDELLASAVFLWSARTLGVKPMELLRGRKDKRQLEARKKTLSSGDQ